MEQEPPDELDRIEGHQPLTVAMGIVFPPKGHPSVLEREEAPIRDGHAVCIACQILQHRPRATPGWLGIHHPLRRFPAVIVQFLALRHYALLHNEL